MNRLKAFWLIVCLCAGLALLFPLKAPSQANTAPANFYVAKDGQDKWSGRLASPNTLRTDGPFATLARARDAVRSLRTSSGAKAPIRVLLRGGTYFITEPIVFTPEDSGTADAPITYAAYPGEKPILSGGLAIKGWKPTTVGRKNLWIVDFPSGVQLSSRQLFVNGKRCIRPRLPKEGLYRIAEVPGLTADTAKTARQTQFRYSPGDIRAWENLTDVEIVALCFWVESRMPIASVDEASRTVSFSEGSIFRLTDDFSMKPAPYYVENVFEALEKPGEFYYNRASQKIYYMPRPGEDMATAEAIMPRQLPHLVQFQGQPETGRFVEYVHLSGLGFAHTEATRPARDWPGDSWRVSGSITAPGTIQLVGARNCGVENNEVAHVGSYGIDLGLGCTRNHIAGNEIYDLGAGGIKVGPRLPPDPSVPQAGNNVISDNHIHEGGQIFHSAYGIHVGHSDHDIIAHNHIHHQPYIGIVVGVGDDTGMGTVIEFNDIHDIGLGMLSDLACIYTIDRAEVPSGVVIRNNVVHDVESRGYGGWGIYFDDGTTGVIAENNIVYRCKSAGFHMHFGNGKNLRENTVRNNIFALSREAEIYRTTDQPQLQFTFEDNIVFWNQGVLFTGNWRQRGYRFEHNVYWDGRFMGTDPEKGIHFGPFTLQEWHERGQDLNSVIADPLFVNPEKGDFTLKPDSPALKLGFSPIDISKVGPRPRRSGVAANNAPDNGL
jgi:parallel beta-helix repeat protein